MLLIFFFSDPVKVSLISQLLFFSLPHFLRRGGGQLQEHYVCPLWGKDSWRTSALLQKQIGNLVKCHQLGRWMEMQWRDHMHGPGRLAGWDPEPIHLLLPLPNLLVTRQTCMFCTFTYYGGISDVAWLDIVVSFCPLVSNLEFSKTAQRRLTISSCT